MSAHALRMEIAQALIAECGLVVLDPDLAITSPTRMDITPDTQPQDVLEGIALEGRVRLRIDNWGGVSLSAPLQSPTWRTVLITIDDMIVASEDLHHCYLEFLRPASEPDAEGIVFVDVDLGS